MNTILIASVGYTEFGKLIFSNHLYNDVTKQEAINNFNLKYKDKRVILNIIEL